MKRTALLAALAAAPLATAQSDSWQFELVGGAGSAANPLHAGQRSATVRLSLGVPAGDYGLGRVTWRTHAGEAGWSDPAALILHPGQVPGEIMGATIGPSTAGQVILHGGLVVTPGRIDVWEATFTIASLDQRRIMLSTETTMYEVYADDPSFTLAPPIARPLPAEGHGTIFVIPAPAPLALLGLSALALARRRR